MGYNMPPTRNGFNMFDCVSLLQKSCRRGLNEYAGFAACELFSAYNTAMWNRITFVSCEDCSGALTKEIIKLRYEDIEANKGKKGYFRDTSYVSKAVYLLTHSNKSRDACYFACNFIIASEYNKTKNYHLEDSEIFAFQCSVDSIPKNVFTKEYMVSGPDSFSISSDSQEGMFGCPEYPSGNEYRAAATMKKAILEGDMETAGYSQNYLRKSHRSLVWKTLYLTAYELGGELCREIIGLSLADDFINSKREFERKDEIFSSKAIMLLSYIVHGMNENIISQECIKPLEFVDFSDIEYPDIMNCTLPNGEFPEWVFDCHTIRGKQNGKNDWQMNVDEQAALTPLKLGFFDEGTWQSLYEWLKDNDAMQPGKFLSPGEYEEHLAYRKGRYNNPLTKDGAVSNDCC